MYKMFLGVCLASHLAMAASYAPADKIICDEFGLVKMLVRIDQADVLKQNESFQNATSFEGALRAALESIMKDRRDSESPLALLEADDIKESGSSTLFNLLNRPSTIFGLVSAIDFADTTLIYPPEHGEQLSEYWVFYLSVPDYSDHMFWALVSRSNPADVYNYGFN